MRKTLQRRQLLQIGLAGLAPTAWQWARAEEKFPSKPLRIIVPLPAGGVADNSVRVLTHQMQSSFGQPILIENKPGGAFMVGLNTVLQAPTDGYTLLHINAGFLSAQAAFKRFDIFKQLRPVAGLGETDTTVSVPGNSPHKSIHELIAFGKANPGKLSYTSPGPGSLEHLALSNFCKAYAIEALHVPTKGGPEVVKALIQGEVDFSCIAVPFAQQFTPSGKLRSLVLLNDRRNAAIPDVPSISDEKLSISRTTVWAGLAAPVGVPSAVIAQLEAVVLEAAKNPEVQKQFSAAGLVPQALDAAGFGKMWRDDYAWIAKAAVDAKLTLN